MYINVNQHPMMINLKKFLKALFEKYKRIVLANSTRTIESQHLSVCHSKNNSYKNR